VVAAGVVGVVDEAAGAKADRAERARSALLITAIGMVCQEPFVADRTFSC